jgi:hypothetical protein
LKLIICFSIEEENVILKSATRKSFDPRYYLSEAVKTIIKQNEVDYHAAMKSTKTISDKELRDHEIDFLKSIQKIETKTEDEIVSSKFFSMFRRFENINAFYTFIAIISAIFSHEFRTRIRHIEEYPSSYLENLKLANTVALAVTSFSVLFFSILYVN